MPIRLHLANFHRIPGSTRYVNRKNPNETISYREFRRRAERRLEEPKPRKPRATVRQNRARWYANKVNREEFIRQSQTREWNPQAYISFEEAAASPDFMFYEDMIHSGYADDRAVGWEFFEGLEEYYEEHSSDWGES